MLPRIDSFFARFSWSAPLVARLVTGLLFATSGWGKINTLGKFTAEFTRLGIPSPEVLAPFVAWVEFIFGVFIVVGLMCRLASLALLIDMIVATATARMKEVHSIGDFLYLSEVLLCALLFWLIITGGGRVSIDYYLRRPLDKSDRSAESQEAPRAYVE